MLASSQGLSEVFPGIQTDASVSRSIMVAPELIGNALSAGSLRQWVLIGLAPIRQSPLISWTRFVI